MAFKNENTQANKKENIKTIITVKFSYIWPLDI